MTVKATWLSAVTVRNLCGHRQLQYRSISSLKSVFSYLLFPKLLSLSYPPLKTFSYPAWFFSLRSGGFVFILCMHMSSQTPGKFVCPKLIEPGRAREKMLLMHLHKDFKVRSGIYLGLTCTAG